MPKEPARLFIDTNVWFSSFYGSANCEKLLKAHLTGKIKAVVSQQIIKETVRNIEEKMPHLLPYVKKFLLNSSLEIVADPRNILSNIKNLVSTEDQPIFASAISAKADIFVTGNIKDFKVKRLGKISGIKIATPKQAVEILGL